MLSYASALKVAAVSAIVVGSWEPVSAQQSGAPSAPMIAAAIKAVRGQFAQGPGRVQAAAHLQLSEVQRSEITRSVGMPFGEMETSRVCTAPSPSACKLVDVVVFLSITQSSSAGDSGVVTLEVLEQTTNKRQPIHGAALTVKLSRQGPGQQWKATSIVPIWES